MVAQVMISIPRFDLPIRYDHGVIVTVQQDSEEDVLNCVETVLRTRIGERIEVRDFGIREYALTRAPIPVSEIIEALRRWVPDADTVITQSLELFDSLHTTIEVDATRRRGLDA